LLTMSHRMLQPVHTIQHILSQTEVCATVKDTYEATNVSVLCRRLVIDASTNRLYRKHFEVRHLLAVFKRQDAALGLSMASACGSKA